MELVCQSLHLCNINHGMSITTFGKTFWSNSPPPPTLHEFLFEILCERYHNEIFYHMKRVNGKHCDRCGNLDLFHNKYPIDIDQLL